MYTHPTTQTPTEAEAALFRQQLLPFAGFTDSEWTVFFSRLGLRKVKKKERFLEAGTVCREIGFILYGSTRCLFVKDGVEITSYFSFPLDMVTAYGSFLKKKPSEVSIEALEDSSLIVLSCEALEALLQDAALAPKLERMGRLIAEHLVCCYEERMQAFITQTPEERYRHLLRTTPGLLQRIPQHHIANYLGVTAVSLSRIRRRLRSRG
jgi:CRP-like cAMP-binding protein